MRTTQTLFSLTLIGALWLTGRPALADIHVVSEQRVNDSDAVQVDHWFTDGKAAVFGPVNMIVDYERGAAWIFGDSRDQIFRHDLVFDDESVPVSVDLKRTGKRKTIGDWETEQYLLRIEEPFEANVEVWVAEDLDLNLAAYRRMLMDQARAAGGQWAEIYRALPGFPLEQVIALNENGQNVRIESRVLRIERTTPAPGLYEPPEPAPQID